MSTQIKKQRTSLASLGFTATASYCRYTGIKIAIGTEFHNIAALRGYVTASAHPIFYADIGYLLQALPQVIQSGLSSERRLIMAALGKSLGIWKLHGTLPECGEVQAEKILELFAELAPRLATGAYERRPHARHVTEHTYPVLVVGEDCTQRVLIDHLQLVVETLNNWDAVRPQTRQEKLDWEVDLERELKRVVSSGKGYTPKLGRWALAQFPDAYTSEQLNAIRKCLNAPASELYPETLDAVIEWAELELPLADDTYRADALKILGHLQAKKQHQRKKEQDFGFVILEDESGAGSGIGGLEYKTKTKIVQEFSKRLTAAEVQKVPTQTASGKPLTSLERALAALKARKAAEAG